MKKKKISKNSKKIILILIILIAIILLNVFINNLEDKSNTNENKNEIATNIGFDSIEGILNYYGCEFISERNSKDSNFSKDIYLKFKYNTFEGEESKQRYYENIISYLADFINQSYRLIDEDKNLLIEVSKQRNEDGTTNFIYIINGQEKFFEINEAKINIQNYKEDKDTNIQINSNILNQLKDNNWKKNNINFGSKDSSFDKYDIYFDEGYEIRTISGKLYNIVFTNKYQEEVINGIKVGTTYEEIIDKLGEPTFGNKEGNHIGYKNSEIYVFFLENEISIYKNEEETDMKEFDEILTQYVENKINIKEFMNKLTYLWPDYEEYTYNSNYIYISYPTKGIKIEMMSDNSQGITIYKNCNITENISKLMEEGKITSKLEEDLVKASLDRKITKLGRYIEKAELTLSDEQSLENNVGSNLYYIYVDEKVRFISKTEEFPNREINEKIDSGIIIADNIYMYSIANKGIYYFNANNGEKGTLITGEEEFKIIDYKDNILKYDDKEIQLNWE